MNDQELREQPLVTDYDLAGWDPTRKYFIHAFGTPEKVRDFYEAERKSNRELLQVMVDALFKAEQYMTSTGDRIGPGCLCHCPVIDGHTGSCPIPPAMRLAASKGITPTHD